MATEVDIYASTLSSALSNLVITNKLGEKVDDSANVLRSLRIGSYAGHTAYLVGNGGSATIASHISIDLNKVCGIRAMALNDSAALTCLSNDYAYEYAFAEQIGFYGKAGDTLIAISSSGKSPNILNAVTTARNFNMNVVTFSGFDPNNPLRGTGHYNFYIFSDSYGIVEVGHMLILHSMVDQLAKELREAA